MLKPSALCRQLRDLDPGSEPETTKQIGREAADLIERLRSALQEIFDSHVPDQPAAFNTDDASWARRHVQTLRLVARKALDITT